ncbi:hypothetical protein [Thalassovita sp.]|uniref:hypothetical protein n=1 Tax=Thalassovita sp. TaxID=1979401 RepID=UPI0029DE8526|nr:hypothetical protein [Thalassovita sp.]
MTTLLEVLGWFFVVVAIGVLIFGVVSRAEPAIFLPATISGAIAGLGMVAIAQVIEALVVTAESAERSEQHLQTLVELMTKTDESKHP